MMDSFSTLFALNPLVFKCLLAAVRVSKNLTKNMSNLLNKSRTMPLKKIVTDAREKVGSSKVSNFNSDVMLNILETNQKKAYEVIIH